MRPGLVVTAAIVALLTLAEAWLVRDAHHLPGFFAAFGVLGSLVLVAVAKGAGKAGLERPDAATPPEGDDE